MNLADYGPHQDQLLDRMANDFFNSGTGDMVQQLLAINAYRYIEEFSEAAPRRLRHKTLGILKKQTSLDNFYYHNETQYSVSYVTKANKIASSNYYQLNSPAFSFTTSLLPYHTNITEALNQLRSFKSFIDGCELLPWHENLLEDIKDFFKRIFKIKRGKNAD